MSSVHGQWAEGRRDAVVVGGSLAGLCTALALARENWRVTVLERSSTPPTGMGIAIDRALLADVTGVDVRRLPVIEAGYSLTGWSLLHDLLRREVESAERICISYGDRVERIQGGRGGRARLQRAGGDLVADLIVGADGHSSIVRSSVAPEHPTATYSGFVLWRGLVDERSTGGRFDDRLGLSIEDAEDGVFATFAIPGADGAIEPGHRRGVFTWFDATRAGDLEAAGKLADGVVRGTWHGHEVPERIVAELTARAPSWRSPWAPAVASVIAARDFIGTPVGEYLPSRMSRGSVALVGDAAHVVSPVTGAGFHNALLDIGSLADALRDSSDVGAALSRYDDERLEPARSLVRESLRWSRRFAGSVSHRPG